MRVLKLALLSFIFIFLLVTIMSLFIPSRIRISKAINIQATEQELLENIGDPAKWKKWYPGADSAKPYLVDGIEKGILFSEEPRTYLQLHEMKEHEVSAKFITRKLRPVDNVWKTINHPTTDSVTLQWYMDFHLRWYPWEKFGSLLLEKSYGTKMEQGLGNLKKLLEAGRTSNN